jgi:aspartate/methionine/tyrosine aminotransferase
VRAPHQTLAEQYSRYMGRTINGLTEVVTSVGATGGLYAIWQGIINDGDEVL